MAALPTYTLRMNGWRRGWVLTRDADQQVVARFPTKEHATRAGGLERVIDEAGGLVRIQWKNGELDEVRTCPCTTNSGSSPAQPMFAEPPADGPKPPLPIPQSDFRQR